MHSIGWTYNRGVVEPQPDRSHKRINIDATLEEAQALGEGDFANDIEL
jgi:hypothetical protein